MATSSIDRRTFLGLTGAVAAGLASEPLHAQSAGAPRTTQGRAGASPYATVEIATGRLRGLSTNGVHAFRGVPYGASTVGPRRFLPPIQPSPWTGVRDAMAPGYRSPQPWRNLIPEIGDAMTGSGPMSDDCLCLHVWAPAAAAARRPVLVFFHGGGDRTGAGSAPLYDGAALARNHDLVVVTVNHRLNGFGYLPLAAIGGPEFAAASNVGLLDLVHALEWVRDNIAAFGGDPGRVTIMGQSGGGGKVAFLLTMPRAAGLFHRAVMMSGGGLPPRPMEEQVRLTDLLLKRLGLARADVRQLQTIGWERLLATMVGATGMEGGDLASAFGPTLDGTIIPNAPFDPKLPVAMPNIPILCGSTETESVPYQLTPDLDPYWTRDSLDDAGLRDRVKRTFRIQDGPADALVSLYRSHRPNASNADLAEIIASDTGNSRTNPWAVGERRAAAGAAPVYVYQFNWYSPVHQGKVRAMHCLDLPFVFDHVDDHTYMTGNGPERAALATTISNAWAAFVRSGNPNHAGLPAWAPYTGKERTVMTLNNECRAVNDPFRDERLALEKLRGQS